MQLFRGLCAVCTRTDYKRLAHWVFIFAFQERGTEFILQSLIKFELESRAAASVDGSQLFRNSIAAATIRCYEKLVGRERVFKRNSWSVNSEDNPLVNRRDP